MVNLAQMPDPTDELDPLEDRNPFRVGLLSMDVKDFASGLETGSQPRRIQVQSGK